jgi:hypothetical protein
MVRLSSVKLRFGECLVPSNGVFAASLGNYTGLAIALLIVRRCCAMPDESMASRHLARSDSDVVT